MTSCGGMASVIVRRSTLTSWSTIGIFQTRPGPRGGSSSRPHLNMTARSYSLRTRTTPSILRILSPHGQPQTVDRFDLDLLARHKLRVVCGMRLPQRTAYKDESGCAHLATLPDHRLNSGLDRQSARRERLP